MVWEDADLDLALDSVVWSAFGTSGQRCTAASRLIVHRAIHDDFVHRLKQRVAKLVLGDGLDEKTDVGPVINDEAVERIAAYAAIGRNEADLVIGGEAARDGDLAKGSFFQPTIFTEVKPDARIAKEEIFGPVPRSFRSTTGRRPCGSSPVSTASRRRSSRATSTWRSRRSATSTPAWGT